MVFLFVSLSNNYVLRILGQLGVPSEEALIGRGMTCMICSIIGGMIFGENLLPSMFKPQIARFFFAGFGLWATIESYHHARASEIALISRLDMPVIILLGFLINLKSTTFQKVSSVFLIACIATSLLIFTDQYSTFLGLALSATGTLLLTLSYLLLSYTSKIESAAIVSLTPALSCLAFGFFISLRSGKEFNYSSTAIFLTFLSGLLMYLSYRTLRHLYRRFHFLKAQVAYLLIPLVSIPIDLLADKKPFRPLEYISFLVISIGVLATCLVGSGIGQKGDRRGTA